MACALSIARLLRRSMAAASAAPASLQTRVDAATAPGARLGAGALNLLAQDLARGMETAALIRVWDVLSAKQATDATWKVRTGASVVGAVYVRVCGLDRRVPVGRWAAGGRAVRCRRSRRSADPTRADARNSRARACGC